MEGKKSGFSRGEKRGVCYRTFDDVAIGAIHVKRIYHVLVSEGFHGTEMFPLDGNT